MMTVEHAFIIINKQVSSSKARGVGAKFFNGGRGVKESDMDSGVVNTEVC